MKEKDEEKLSKVVLDWLTNIVTFITILAGILGVFLPDQTNAEKYAWGLFIPLAVLSAIFIYLRYSRLQKKKIAKVTQPLAASATLRGLLPFEDGDPLPGRGRDVQDLYTLVANSTFRFGVVWGESGCGKTSMLRAGLVPRLRESGNLPVYVPKPGSDPMDAIRSVLIRMIPDLTEDRESTLNQLLTTFTKKDARVVIILDQFEEFFLSNRTAKSRTAFIKWLQNETQRSGNPVAVLVAIRADFFAQLQNFAPHIPEPTSIRTSYQLQNFDTEQAKQIFSEAAQADGIAFEPDLIHAIIDELAVEEFVRPAELQVVGSRLKRRNITTLNKYGALGGARGILSSYIHDEIKQSSNEHVARLILRLMCAEVSETKALSDLSLDEIVRGVQGGPGNSTAPDGVRPAEVRNILEQFVSARVLLRTDEGKYNLAHDYLAPYVTAATEGVETHTERANKLLKRYVSEYRDDPKFRIPFRRLRFITKYASTETRQISRAQEVVQKSRRAYWSLIASPLLLVGLLYLFLACSYYFDMDGYGYVVIRSGHPKFEYVPGFDQVVIQTNVTNSDLLDGARDVIVAGDVTGFWLDRTPGGAQLWGQQLTTLVGYDDGTRMLRWIDPSILVDQLGSEDSHLDAYYALNSLASISPEHITPKLQLEMLRQLSANDARNQDEIISLFDTLSEYLPQYDDRVMQELLHLLNDDNPDVRWAAVQILRSYAAYKPEQVSQEILAGYLQRLGDPNENVQAVAIDALQSAMRAEPSLITSDFFEDIMSLLANGNEAESQGAVDLLQTVQKTAPEQITTTRLQTIIDLLDSENPGTRASAATLLGIMFPYHPDQANSVNMQKVSSLLDDPNSDVRSGALKAITPIASAARQFLTPEFASKAAFLLGDPDPQVRMAAVSTTSRIMQSAPEMLSPEDIKALAGMLADPDLGVRSRASSALQDVVNLPITTPPPEYGQALVPLLEEELETRETVVYLLGELARINPEAVPSNTVEALLPLLGDANWATSVNVRQSIVKIAQSDPAGLTPEAFLQIRTLAEEGDAGTRSEAITLLGDLVAVIPQQYTNQTLDQIFTLLAREDWDVRFQAYYAYKQLIALRPDVFTPDHIEKLFTLLEEQGTSAQEVNFRNSILNCILSMAQARPDLIPTNATDRLLPLLYENNTSPITETLRTIIRIGPEYVSAEQVQMLIETLPQAGFMGQSNISLVLTEVATSRPEQITPEVTQALLDLLTTNNADYYNEVAPILSPIFQKDLNSNNRQILQSRVQLLNLKGTDTSSNTTLQLNAIKVIEIMTRASPETITPDVLSEISSLFSKGDSLVDTEAIQAVGNIMEARPDLITPEIVQALFGFVDRHGDQIGLDVAFDRIASSRPDLFTPEVVDQVRNLFDDDAESHRAAAYGIAGYIIRADPRHADPELIKQITVAVLMDDSNYVRSGASFDLAGILASDSARFLPIVIEETNSLIKAEGVQNLANLQTVLYLIVQYDPEAIPPDMARELLLLFDVSSENAEVLMESNIQALVLATQKYLSAAEIEALIARLENVQGGYSMEPAYTLGQVAKFRPDLFPTETLETLYALLKNDRSADERNGAVEALYYISAADPDLKETITLDMLALANNPKPHWRLAAGEVLEKIASLDQP